MEKDPSECKAEDWVLLQRAEVWLKLHMESHCHDGSQDVGVTKTSISTLPSARPGVVALVGESSKPFWTAGDAACPALVGFPSCHPFLPTSGSLAISHRSQTSHSYCGSVMLRMKTPGVLDGCWGL